jgi:biopolymer transport protein ExbD
MNKKTLCITLILLSIITVGVVFAASSISITIPTTTTVKVTNMTNNTVQGDVCIYLIHKNGKNQMTDNFPYKLKAYKSDTYYCPSDWTIYNASEISCFVLPE